MTNKELQEELKKYPDEAHVLIYGTLFENTTREIDYISPNVKRHIKSGIIVEDYKLLIKVER